MVHAAWAALTACDTTSPVHLQQDERVSDALVVDEAKIDQ
jgi:hypothetical protein